MASNFTEMEAISIDSLVSLLHAEPGFSDVTPKDLERGTGIPMTSLRGVIGSLVKKGVFWVDNSCGVEIVYLQEQHWHFHPRWDKNKDVFMWKLDSLK